MTSNLKIEAGLALEKAAREVNVRSALAEVLRPEFVNRIDEIVEFSPLGQRQLELLVDKQLSKLNERVQERGLRLSIGPGLRRVLLDSAVDGKFGGRALKRAFQSLVIDSVSEQLIELNQYSEGAWCLDCDDTRQILWRRSDGDVLLLSAAQG
jgi:ATP-dependent Clp protease ATP-binding subunit ClpA